MILLEPEQLNSTYADHQALFFTEEGILMEAQASSPFLPFERTRQCLNVTPTFVYLYNSVLIVKCQRIGSLEHLLERGFHLYDERTLLVSLEDQDTRYLVLKALQWLAWDEKLQYCSKCGQKVQRGPESIEKRCYTCNLSFFPKFSPAVMVLIQRDDEILLARSAHFKPGFYSALAGFVEMGETAEQAAHREVKEEVDLEISDLEYFGTQSWPFPDSFMIAFKAKYLRGDLHIDTHELEDARWFKINNLPDLPSHASISRQLIESCVR